MLATLLLALGAMLGAPSGAAAVAPAEDGTTTASSLSTSHSHTCALLTDDTAACWGDNDQGQSKPPKGGTFRQLSTGGRQTCAITTDGKASCWGSDTDGQASAPDGTFSQVDAGTSHSCGIKTDGSLVCWGNDEDGRSDPPDGTFTQVSAGDLHSCAVRTDGTVACWGKNDPDGRATPPDGTFRQVSAGETASCGLRSDGSIACWGDSANGQTTPPSGTFTQVSAGDGDACALATDGSLACWGADDYKQSSPPEGTFVAVSAGYLHSCALATDGSVVCWGFDSGATKIPDKLVFGRSTASAGGSFSCGVQTVGTGVCWGSDAAGEGTAPDGTFSQVSSGPEHSCGLRSDGTAVCWGKDDVGQATAPGGTFSALSVGGSHSCGIAADGSAVCWGGNDKGQSTPVPGSWSQISAGDAHTCALATDGRIACWGDNDAGQSTPPSGTFTQVSAGTGQTCAVKTDGSLACWGRNDQQQATPPGGTFIAVSAADGYSCGLADSGKVSCWGADASGALTPPADAFVTISAGTGHACGQRADGLVACWGDDSVGQSNPPVPGAPVVETPLADQTATQGSDFDFSFDEHSFSDPNKLKISYAATRADGTPLPGWIHLDGGNRTFRGKPGNDDVGTLSVTVTATNEKKLSIGDTFDIVVANRNDPPKAADHIPDQSTKEDAAFSFVVPDGSFSDPDSSYGDVLTLSATRRDGTALPAWISLDAATSTLSGTPADADVGKLAVRLTATDTAGASASQDFTVSVANVNDPPQLAIPVAGQSASQGKAFSLVLPTGTFSDPDLDSGDHLTLAASLADGSPLPAWLRFDAGRATFAGTPGNADVGDLSIILTGTDTAGASASTTFPLRVANVNDPPVVAQGIPDQAIDEDSLFSLVVPADAFADPDAPYGDTLAFSATRADGTPLPAWLVLDPATGTLSGTPRAGDVGSLEVRVTASDQAGASIDDDFSIRVAHVDHAPTVAQPIAPQTATQGTAFTFTLPATTFADVDPGDALVYDATLYDGSPLPSWLRFDRNDRSLQGTPSNADVGTLSVMVKATDPAGAPAATTFDIVVANRNDPPKAADHIPDQSTKEDAAFSFVVPDGSFSDPDSSYGDVLTLSASRQDGTALPAWISLDAATSTLSGTPADADVGKLAVRLTATDTAGASASQDFTVSVANVNDPPQLAIPVAGQSASQGKAFSLVLPSATFSDPDLDSGDHLGLAASLADGTPLPGWLHFDAGRGTFAGTPGNADVGDLSIILTTTDTAGASASTTFALRVANVNDPPVVAQGIPDQAVDEDSLFSLVVPADAFADPDSPYGDTLAFSASRADGSPLPAWLTLDPASGTLSGTPRAGDVGSLEVRVTASDQAGASIDDDFSIRVAHVDHAPTVAQPIAPQTATQGTAFTFTLPATTFADVDPGDALVYDATLYDGSPLPSWLRFDRNDRSLQGTPSNADVRLIVINFIATDKSGLHGSAALLLDVANVNDPPSLANPIPDQAATQASAFSFTIAADAFSDPDAPSGDTLTLGAKKGDGSALPAWLTFDAASGTFSGTPTDLDVGSLGVTVTATDSGAQSATGTFTISVANVNDAPVISDPVADLLATENQAFTYSVAVDAFSDAPSDVAAGDTLAYGAARDDGTPLPAWLTFDPATRTFSGTPLKPDVGSVGVTITATDKAGATGTDSFAISVIASHDDPTPPSVTLRRGKTAAINGAIPVLLDWSAGLEAQNQAHPTYNVQLRTARDSTWSDWKTLAIVRGRTGVNKTLLPGHQQLRIQVGGAKPGPWIEGAPFVLGLVQDKDPAVTYSGDWASVADKSASGGTLHRTTAPGAAVSFTTADAETIGLVMPTGPSYGVMHACIDAGTATESCRSLDLSAQGGVDRRLVMQFTPLAAGSHTLTITDDRGAIALDALIVVSQPEPAP